MPKTKPFDRLRKTVDADPERRKRIERIKREMETIELGQLRTSLAVTQEELAKELDVSQANVSRIERQDDLYLSTLSTYIAALGGHLEVSAVFPDRTITILADEEKQKERTAGPRARQ